MNSCSCTYNLLFLVDICSQIIDSVFRLLNMQLKIKPSSTHWSSRNQVLFQKKREEVCAQTSTDSLPQDQVKGLHVFPQTLFYTTASALT